MGIQLPGVEADELESSLICLAAQRAEVRALDPRNRIALSWARAKHREEVVKLLREGRGFPLVPWYALLWRERFELWLLSVTMPRLMKPSKNSVVWCQLFLPRPSRFLSPTLLWSIIP